jgi:hypothetical protein
MAGIASPVRWFSKALASAPPPLEQFEYGDVALTSELHERQLEENHIVLMGLSDDSLLKPLR